MADGTCQWRAVIQTGGTGISAGTGAYSLTVPIAPLGSFPIIGHGWIYGTAGFKTFEADISGSTARLIRSDSGALVDNTVGFTTAGHALSVAGSYRYA